jgi:hypothetical protein
MTSGERPVSGADDIQGILSGLGARVKAGKSPEARAKAIADALAKLDPERRSQVERRLRDIPERFHRTYIRSLTSKSLRVHAKVICGDCMGWEMPEVRRCLDLACDLWPHRPGGRAKRLVEVPDEPPPEMASIKRPRRTKEQLDHLVDLIRREG